jgi:hypothetical protein
VTHPEPRGHRCERNRAARRAARERKWTPSTTQAPTDPQVRLLRALAAETGQTFAIPRTRRQAVLRIEQLLALKRRGKQ